MGMFFIYSIKVAICLAAFYLFYKLLLSRDTFHAFNRATLLLLMLLSLVLPFVNISVDEPTVAYNGMVQIEQLLTMGVVDDGTTPSGLTLTQVLFAIYIIGVAFLLQVRYVRSSGCIDLFREKILLQPPTASG